MSKKKVYALLVKPNNKPKITELEDDDKAIKEIVGGEYDSIYYPPMMRSQFCITRTELRTVIRLTE